MENGEWGTWNPLLAWDDFRERNIKFRIIEIIRGNVNVTFGFGTKDQFDHIGFLVTKAEYEYMISTAEQLDWKVSKNEKRTFLSTPWKFRIELVQEGGMVEEGSFSIQQIQLRLMMDELSVQQLTQIFNLKVKQLTPELISIGNQNWEWQLNHSSQLQLMSVLFRPTNIVNDIDPVGVQLGSSRR